MTGEGINRGGHEPSLQTVEMLCDRLAELGLAIGPEQARALAREVLASEAPRVDARLRDALYTALQTIRVAAQSGMGMLATAASDNKEAPLEQLHVSRRPPAQQQPPAAPAAQRSPQRPPEPRHPEPRAEPKRPSGPRRPKFEIDEDERRPMFRRPGRR
jgi:hypothetical protein